MTTERITPRQFHETAGVEDWRVVGEGAVAYFRLGSLAAGARLVQAISELDGHDDHHCEVDLRDKSVTVRLFTTAPAPDGLSTRDVVLAPQISAVARELGVAADPSAVQSFHISIDALVRADVMPFWRAVLGAANERTSPPFPSGACGGLLDGRMHEPNSLHVGSRAAVQVERCHVPVLR